MKLRPALFPVCLISFQAPCLCCADAEESPWALVAAGRGQLTGACGTQKVGQVRTAGEYLQVVRSFKGLEAPVAGGWLQADRAGSDSVSSKNAELHHPILCTPWLWHVLLCINHQEG